MTLDRIFRLLQLVGLILLVPGLWDLAGGLRTVVSGRIDERRESARSVKKGIVLSALGVLILIGATGLANWAAK